MTKNETLEAAARGEGCLGRTADDEPVFVLRANDRLAAGAVAAWADLAAAIGVNPEKVEDARRVAEAFTAWKREQQAITIKVEWVPPKGDEDGELVITPKSANASRKIRVKGAYVSPRDDGKGAKQLVLWF